MAIQEISLISLCVVLLCSGSGYASDPPLISNYSSTEILNYLSNEETTKSLLKKMDEQRFSVNDSVSNGNDTVLTMAARLGRVEVVERLLKAGADPNVIPSSKKEKGSLVAPLDCVIREWYSIYRKWQGEDYSIFSWIKKKVYTIGWLVFE